MPAVLIYQKRCVTQKLPAPTLRRPSQSLTKGSVSLVGISNTFLRVRFLIKCIYMSAFCGYLSFLISLAICLHFPRILRVVRLKFAS